MPDNQRDSDTRGKAPHLLIVGPANSGKSALYNALVGAYSEVANYPHTTVTTFHRGATIGDRVYDVWDTPGLNSLNLGSADERITRDAMLSKNPDIFLFVADATRLKRSLMLLAQVVELDVPTVVILNKMDAAAQKGIAIDPSALERRLGLPVVVVNAIDRTGVDQVAPRLINAAITSGPDYPKIIEKKLTAIQSQFTQNFHPSRGLSLLYLAGESAAKLHLIDQDREGVMKANDIVASLSRTAPSLNLSQSLFNRRENWADAMADLGATSPPVARVSFGQRAAWASRHPVLGWPILLAIMYVTFLGVAIIATNMATLLETWIFTPLTTELNQLITWPLLNEFLLGNFGIITMGVINALVTVTPILIVFFVIVNFLEDVGYLPNLSVLLNRLFTYFGLTGRSVLSMSLGFGCNTMATLTSRMLETRKERIIASALIALGLPCAVQLGVMIAILSTAPFSALLLVVGTVLLTQIIVGLLMNRLITTDKGAEFIIELPPFRLPDWRNIVRKTKFRVFSFFNEALPLFVLGAALMFLLEKTGLLEIIKSAAAPIIVQFLSMPEKTIEVFILVISRRELGAVYFKNMVDAGMVDYYQVVVGLTVMTLFIPCISNTMVMIKELGIRWALSINAGIMVIAILMGGLLNILMRTFLP